MAAPEDDYYHRYVKPHVDGRQIEYLGELDHAGKVELLGGAYATAPQGLYSNLIALLAKSGLETHLWGIPPEQFGVPAEEITDTIDIAPFLDRKLAALRCHRTQYDASHAFLHLSSELGAQIFSHEYFRRIW